MTTIVGLVKNSKIFMAADSCVTSWKGCEYRIMDTKKTFKKQVGGYWYLIGSTGTSRAHQLIRHSFTIPVYNPRKSSALDYMVNTFAKAMMKCLKENEYSTIKENRNEMSDSFLVGFCGKLYEISGDFAVCTSVKPYEAVGCGWHLALGAMHTFYLLV